MKLKLLVAFYILTAAECSQIVYQEPDFYYELPVKNLISYVKKDNSVKDGSYSFSHNAGDLSRKVLGHYSYPNLAALNDPSYKHGAVSDIVVTGGTLAAPNGLTGKVPESDNNSAVAIVPPSQGSLAESSAVISGDGSYSFSYDAGDSSRSESADANGNVQGQYAYTNNAGHHDLSYKAGADSGFVVTRGSLAVPNGLTGKAQDSENNSPVAVVPASQGSLPESLAVMSGDGSYSFSYDAGDSSRSESADANGNVQGQYAYTNNAGHHDLSYKAGADSGFVVTGGSLAVPNGLTGKAQDSENNSPVAVVPASQGSLPESLAVMSGDGSYSFSYDAGDSSRSESSDANGNVQGQYAYTNNAGHHDLSYKAGADTGFVVTGGSLAVPNGLTGKAQDSDDNSPVAVVPPSQGSLAESSAVISGDGSYSFSYDAGDSSRSESADANGNVQGHYAYTNNAGHHDLSYKAGADSGFVVTGGSLAVPNGLTGKAQDSENNSPVAVVPASQGSLPESLAVMSGDGSYSFSYDAGDSSRSESADANGNVQGQYAYTNNAGQHDLSYKAGADSGFVVTGGSLAVPNGLTGKAQDSENNSPVAVVPASQGSLPESLAVMSEDGSYSFSYDAGDSSRSESSDANGNVQGQYAYTNNAGHHDLSYKAGAYSGFVVTGGSLAVPNGLTGKAQDSENNSPVAVVPSSQGSLPVSSAVMSGDGSYSFLYDAGDSSRSESADSNGNVQGQYAYTNNAGHHDLSYKAGADSGFVVTRGSLAVPNGLTGKAQDFENNSPVAVVPASQGSLPESLAVMSGDGSYSFSYDAGDSSRSESSDANGNVQGQYAYTNNAGHHDLSYKAGADSGFVVTGGSLAVPNGLTGKVLNSDDNSPVAVVPSSQGSLPVSSAVMSGDGSYSFLYDAGDSSRSESADSNGNVQGQYAYTNNAGHHDLSYKAGADTGFVVTGGSLAVPNGLTGKVPESDNNSPVAVVQPSQGSLAESSAVISGDGSYSFSYDAGDSSRSESGDANGNVQGQYAYTNNAGHHDLSYKAGADSGFVVTGGSGFVVTGQNNNERSSSDGSYSFYYDTGDSYRTESSDSKGDVLGYYAYNNQAGKHDLAYEAGPGKGFIAKSGTLSKPNGLQNLNTPPLIHWSL